MWLDLRVVDARGAQIYRLGAVRNGETEEGTKSFKVVLGDSKGEVVKANILDADRVLYDTRIEPHGYRDVEYMIDIPESAQGPLKVTADLNYWSFSQVLLDHLMGGHAPQAHITLLAERIAQVPLKRLPATASRAEGRPVS
jgi:hypothetical protein